MGERIRAEHAARARTVEKENDARLRLVRELERIAYSDVRDVIQWDVEPAIDKDGTIIGERPVMRVTPSHLLTKEQAAQVRALTTKSGGLRFETHDKLGALAQLARILGLIQPQEAAPSTTINNTQINVAAAGETNALEMARRLAFALEKAARALPATAPAAIEGPILDLEASHAPGDRPKG